MTSKDAILGFFTVVLVVGVKTTKVHIGIIKDGTIENSELQKKVTKMAKKYESNMFEFQLQFVDPGSDMMERFKDVKCIIDFSLNNEYANELGETLQLPVVTSAPNVAPLGKFTLSMYPDYELVNNITVAALERWNIDPVALLYDVTRSEQAANLQSMARKSGIRMILMPEINMNNRHNISYVAGELKRSHLSSAVLLCDPREIYKVMDEALEFNLYENQKKWKWLTPDLDLQPNCTETLHGFVGLAMKTPQDTKIENKRDKFRKDILKLPFRSNMLSNTFYANLHDAILLVVKAVNNKSGDCLLERLRWAKFPSCAGDKFLNTECGLSGKVEFHANRTRKITEMNVVVIDKNSNYGSKNGIRNIAEWARGKRVMSNNDVKWVENDNRKKCNLGEINKEKKTYKILVKNDDRPFVFIDPDANLPMLKRFTGFCIDIVKELAKPSYMNFNFTIEIEDGSGSRNVNTSRWSGIIGKLIEQKADMGTGSLTITAAREEAIDFSKPFMDFTMALILRKPEEEKQNIFRFLDPFSKGVWICTVVAVFAMTISMYILDYLSPYGYRKTAIDTDEPGDEFTLYNSLWFATASMLQQGGDNTPKSPSGRLLAASFWFFVLLMISTYTANLAAFFTNKKPKSTINNLEDLVKQSKIKYGVYKNGQLHTFLKNSNDTVYKKMFMHMMNEETFQTSATAAVNSSRKGGFSYLTETPILEYHNSLEPCNTMLVENLMEAKSYGFALPKNSELTTNLSVNILKLREKGVMDDRYRFWWKKKADCSTTVKPKGLDSMTIKFKNMAGVLIVLVSGVIISFILLVMEVKFKWIIDLILETGCEQCTDYGCDDDESYEYMEPEVADATSPSSLKRVPDAYSNAQESKV